MAGGASVFASEMEELPRASLQALSANIPRALVEKLLRCAADELVRDRVVQRAKSPVAVAAASQAESVAGLVPEWQALGLDLPALRALYGVVCAILVNFAKENPQGATAQRQALQEFGLNDPEFVSFFLPILLSVAPKIQAIFEQTSFDFANVIDVTWRLDYVLRSNTAGSVHEPLYFVQLKLQSPSGGIENLEFACSVEELRDLVYRLQEAANEVEKLASGFAAPPSPSPASVSMA